jgi:hypothetical protein
VSGGARHAADDALIMAIAVGRTREQAAERTGASVATVYRRLGDPGFRRRVAEARAPLLEQAIGRLVDATTEAADTLRSRLTAEPESVRLGAAKTLFEQPTKGLELLDPLREVEQPERSASTREGKSEP